MEDRMFPSPQEQEMLKSIRKEFNSGITPQQFGLEKLRIDELCSQARFIENSTIQADLHEQALKSRRFVKRAVGDWMDRARQLLRFMAPAG